MTISEVAKITNLPKDTLRFYEKIGLLPYIPRKSNNIRDYTIEHICLIKNIQNLKSTGMCLEDISNYLKLEPDDNKRKKILMQTRHQLLKQLDTLKVYLKNIEIYLSSSSIYN